MAPPPPSPTIGEHLLTAALVPVWIGTAATALYVHAVMQVPAAISRRLAAR